MSKLQRFEKVVIKYHETLFGRNIGPRVQPDIALKEVSELSDEMNAYLDSQTTLLIKWCDYNVRNFGTTHHIVIRPIFFFWQKIIDFHLNKYSYNLSKVGLLQDRVDAFQKRLMQIKVFCNN